MKNFARFGVVFALLAVLLGSATAAVKQASLGPGFGMAILDDGSLWSWGADTFGNLGNGPQLSSTVKPAKIAAGFAQVSSGASHTLAIKTDGTLWAWGQNSYGQLGEGQRVILSETPIQIGTGFSQVSAGPTFSLAIKQDGTLWAWGDNYSGQIGNGQAGSNQLVPVQIGSNFIKAVAGRGYALALKSDGSLWGWGNDFYGQFGRGDVFTLVTRPTQVFSNVADMAANSQHTLILKTDSSLWSWGYNFAGELGIGVQGGSFRTAQRVGDGFARVGTSPAGVSMALKTDGSLWTWGANQFGTLGNGKIGSSFDSSTPIKIGNGFVSIAPGAYTMGAIRADGTLFTWGFGTSFGFVASSIDTMDVTVPNPTPVSFGSLVSSPFSTTPTISGGTAALTLSVDVNLASEHNSGTTLGTMFVIAISPDGLVLTLTPAGWQYVILSYPVGWSNTLSSQTVTLVRNQNLTSLRGLAFFVGYGLGSTPAASLDEMIASQRYKLVHVVQ